jgi:hypothetical protein
MDSAKRGGSRPPEPQNSGANALAPQATSAPAKMVAGDPRQQLFQLLHDRNQAHLADAVEHANISASGGDLNISAPKSYGLYFRDPAFEECVREVFGRPLRVKFTPGEAAAADRPVTAAPPPAAAQEDEASSRALANPEVQRFRDVFGGEVRKIRNLKE